MKRPFNRLLLFGIYLSCLMIFVLAYTAWKILFYVESQNYGVELSRALLFGARLGNKEIINSPLFSRGKFSLESFDYFPKDFLSRVDVDRSADDIRCDSMTDIHSVFSYSASVTCRLAGEKVYYFFSKSYDRPYFLVLIIGVAVMSVAGAFRFFMYVGDLQNQNFQKTIELQKEQLVLEVGAKLVHDLKKGVLSQLNTLYQEFGRDLEMEMLQPDFAERLQSKLTHHFQHIDFLNKYISLLTANLKREKEANWISLTDIKLREYLNLIFPTRDFRELPASGEEGRVKFVYRPGASFSELQGGLKKGGFQVPEMSFFRILKNLSENFNAYGKGELMIVIVVDDDKKKVTVRTTNPINENITERPDSTNLGHIIIRQLLADNFGNESRLAIHQDKKTFSLEMSFPLWQP